MSDQTLVPMDEEVEPKRRLWKCNIGWHDYTPWSRPVRHLISYAKQGRICRNCGRGDVRFFKAG